MLQQVLLNPGDDVARFVEWFAIDEEARYLALSACGNQVLLGGAAISSLLSTRAAVSFLVFTLLYTPCVAAIATIRRELDSRLKTVGVVILQCSVAWVVAFVAYAIAGLV